MNPGVSRCLFVFGACCIAAQLALVVAGGASGRAATTDRDSAARPAKLDSSLAQLELTASARSFAAARLNAGRDQILMSANRARVIVEAARSMEDARQTIASVGGTITGASAPLLRALVPVNSLRDLSEQPSVAYVRLPDHPFVADQWDEGLRTIHALSWQRHGHTGAGVKIAVIDLGFRGWSDEVTAGVLPAGVHTVDDCGGGFASGTNHGTAVAEVVHSVAPDADLYLICVADEIDLANAEDYAEANGITIVDHSVDWPNTSRGDGSGGPGSPDAIVAKADAAGILWVNAAGDTAQEHWDGTYNDSDGDGNNNFTSKFDWLGFSTPEGQSVCVYLKWDSWPTTAIDYDLYVTASQTGQTEIASTTRQTGSQPPIESGCFESNTGWGDYEIFIKQYGQASGTPRMDVTVMGGTINSNIAGTPSSSVLEPASSPHAFDAGAFCYYTGAVEPYSALGPTIDGRTAPDILGPDEARSYTLDRYSDWACNGQNGFAGTSAAAAYVAAAAALVKADHPDYTPTQLRSYLDSHALPAGTPGDDDTYGNGLLSLPSLGPELVDYPYVEEGTPTYIDTLYGDSIGDATSVVVGGVPAQFTVDNDAQIDFTTPRDAVSGEIDVNTPEGTVEDPLTIQPIGLNLPIESGPVGTHMRIIGWGLKGATSVTFNGTPATSFDVVSGQEVDAVVPVGATSGPVQVTVLGGDSAIANQEFTITTPTRPTISSVTPTSGGWGTQTEIIGTGLVSTQTVTLGGISAPFTVQGDNGLTVTIPDGAGSGPFTVTTAGGVVTSKARFVVRPTVSSVEPTSARAGESVVLTGTAFVGVRSVALGKAKATFIVNSPTQITVNVPTKAASGPFVVSTTGGSAMSPQFSLLPTISSFKPTAGRVGATVKVTGYGFSGTTSLTLNGMSTVFKASATSVSFRVPSGATNGPIKVTTPAGTVTSATAFTVVG